MLIAVPALAWIVARTLDLPRAAEVGIMLMAISPGAPVALRRSLGAGGDRSFAPALQIAVATLAVVSMPLSIAAFDEYYGGSATVDPRHLARQVFTAQLLPLSLGMLTRRFAAARAAWLEPRLRRLGGLLLILLLVLALIDIWEVVVGAGLRVTLAIVLATVAGALRRASAGRPGARDPHGDRHFQRGAQPRARAAGRDAESCATGHRGDDSRLSRDRGLHRDSLRDLAPARCAARTR